MTQNNTLNIRILTPEKEIVSTDAEMVFGRAVDGAFGILPGHTAYTTVLRAGPFTVVRGGQEETYQLTGGLLQVEGGHVTVLADGLEEEQATDHRLQTTG